jgi:IclR family transcriptional regulator, KDG regulon repressor
LTAKTSDVNYQVRAVTRALKILLLFNTVKPELSLSEISELSKLNKSTILRLLAVLREERFIEQNPVNEKYSLGIRSFEIGSVYYLCHLRVNQVARRHMESLCHSVNLTTNLAILDSCDVVYIGIEEPQGIIRLNLSVGSRFGIHYTALGKVLVSNFSDEMIDSIIKQKDGLEKRTEKTITCPDLFKQHLREVKERGYAIDDEEGIFGIKCIAAPIFDYSGSIIAALSISGMSVEVTEERIPELVKELKQTTQEISYNLGYKSRE